MSDDTIAEADCALCRDLDPVQRLAMRTDLILIPLHEPVCDQCVEAFTANLFASFPKTEEEKMRRREEMARAANKCGPIKEVGLAIPAFVLTFGHHRPRNEQPGVGG
jgi:hypothetical protein